ncbi:MAG TPA: YggT family protein [Longilinea sp.]|nr:YggT family protein [Longilinea sp.]
MTTHNVDVGPEDRREKVTLQQQGGFEHQEKIVEDKGLERQLMTDRITRFIYLAFGILESLIGLRVILKLIDANPANTFARLLYEVTDLFLKPFISLVVNPASGGLVLEITSLIAMVVFAMICWMIDQLVRLILYRTRTRTVAIVNKERQ